MISWRVAAHRVGTARNATHAALHVMSPITMLGVSSLASQDAPLQCGL